MRKLMWFSIGFAAAVLVGIYCLSADTMLLAAAISAVALVGAIAAMRRYAKVRICTAILLGCAVGFTWTAIFDAAYLSVPRAADEQTLTMTLTATDYSEQTDYGVAVQGTGRLNGKLYRMRIYLPSDTTVCPGDRLTGTFRLKTTLPDTDDDSTYYAAKGMFLTAQTSKMPQIEAASSLPWYGYPAYVRRAVKETLYEAVPEDAVGFAVALLIGDKEYLDYETNTAFKISGISHVIAVSGLHVGILFGLVYLLVGRKNTPALLVGVPILFFFAAVAGFSPSIMRACIMYSLMLLATAIDKEYDPPTALAFAVFVMLLADPWTVASVSFQLSVSCVAGIFLFAEPIRTWLMDKKRLGCFKGRVRKAANAFSASVSISLGATVFVTPLCAYYFGTVSLAGPLTNLLTLWIVSAIFYGAMAVTVLGLIWAPLGAAAGWLVAWPIRYVLTVAKAIAAFPLSAVYTDSVYIVAWLIFIYILFGVFLLLKQKRVGLTALCAVTALCVALMASWVEPLFDDCRVTVLDVGQGQCVVLQSAGKTFVVDCGGSSDTNAADTAANRLMSQGIFSIDGLILTHYDRDHAAGAAYLLQRIPTKTLYLPNCADVDGTSRTLATHTDRRYTEETTSVSFGNTVITLIPSQSDLSDNESGQCILFQTEKCAILITGDRTMAGEQELMRMIDLPKLDMLIVGHHGSKYSTDPQLLALTRPEVAVISVGENTYGHPTQEVLERLAQVECTVFRTDIHGTVVFRR